jgi:formiminotetrahydrofolate cyclodeaminase
MAGMTMGEQTFSALLGSIAAKTPTPGGGAVTAAVGALAAALAGMVVAFTTGKKKFTEHEAELQRAVLSLERARGIMLALAAEDEQAYGELNGLLKLPEDDSRRGAELAAVVAASIQVPLAVIAASVDLLRLFGRLAAITNPMLKSDLAIAAVLAEATARASVWNVRANLGMVEDAAERGRLARSAEAMLEDAALLMASVERACA